MQLEAGESHISELSAKASELQEALAAKAAAMADNIFRLKQEANEARDAAAQAHREELQGVVQGAAEREAMLRSAAEEAAHEAAERYAQLNEQHNELHVGCGALKRGCEMIWGRVLRAGRPGSIHPTCLCGANIHLHVSGKRRV